MKIPIYQRGAKVGISGPIVLFVHSKPNLGSFQIELVYEVKVQEIKRISSNLSEYRVYIDKTGDISLSTDIFERLTKLKDLVMGTQAVYYEVPEHVLAIPLLAAITLFGAGVFVGKNIKRR